MLRIFLYTLAMIDIKKKHVNCKYKFFYENHKGGTQYGK